MRYRRRGMRRTERLSILCARDFCMGLKWGFESFKTRDDLTLILDYVISIDVI